jgi:hypothetical protein
MPHNGEAHPQGGLRLKPALTVVSLTFGTFVLTLL